MRRPIRHLWILILAALTGVAPASFAQDDGDGRTSASPDRALDHHVLRAVYIDLLGRSPYRREVDRWLGKGLRELTGELIGSKDHWDAWTAEQLYYFLLIDNFRPRSERVVQIPEFLEKKKLDVREATHRICLSSSFELRNPGADTFVTVVMEQLTGIEVQKKASELEIGKRIYDGGEGLFLGKTGSSQADVVKIAIESKQFTKTFLEREYLRILRAEPGKKEIASWVRKVHKKPRQYTDVLRDWFLSDAYRERLSTPALQPNRLFVRTMFVDLLDRLPTQEEAEPLREALDGLSDSAPLRSVVARLLLDSDLVKVPKRGDIDDPTAWINGLFQRFLGRDAAQDELTTFVAAFSDEACRPETVIYALLSHPEYHTY